MKDVLTEFAGAGDKLRDSVKNVIDETIALMIRDRPVGGGVSQQEEHGPGQGHSPESAPASGPSAYEPHAFPTSSFQDQTSGSAVNPALNGSGERGNEFLTTDTSLGGTNPTQYQGNTAQYTYPDPAVASSLSYSAEGNIYANPAYPAPDGSLPTDTAATVTGSSTVQQPTNAGYALYANGTTAGSAGPPATTPYQGNIGTAAGTADPHAAWNPGSMSWRRWTDAIAGNLEPQECYSASALMQLGGRDLKAASAAGTNGGGDANPVGTTTMSGNGMGPAPIANMASSDDPTATATAAAVAAVAAAGELASGAVAPWPSGILGLEHGGGTT